MKCPCEGCIVRVFCKQKKFSKFRFCNEISHYLGFEGKSDQKFPINVKIHMKNFPKFYKVLNPTRWKYSHWEKGNYRYKKDYRVSSL